MMKKIIFAICSVAIIIVVSVIFTMNNSTDTDEVSNNSSLPLQRPDQMTPFTFEEEIAFQEYGLEEIKKPVFQLGDPELEKWILRTIVSNQMMDIDMSDDDIIDMALREKQETEDFINFAESHYGIVITDDMFDAFITEHVAVWDQDLSNKLALAERLGLTMHEFNYEFDRDLNTKLLVWTLLEPILAKKYSIDTHNFLLQTYLEEVNQDIK